MRFNNQKGQIAILIPIIIFIAGLFLFVLPKKENPEQAQCMVGEENAPTKVQYLSAIEGMNNNGRGGGGWSSSSCNGPYDNRPPAPEDCRKFILIRKKVGLLDEERGNSPEAPHGMKSLFRNQGDDHARFYKIVSNPNYDPNLSPNDPNWQPKSLAIIYPGQYGELTMKDKVHVKYQEGIGDEDGELRFRQQGILFYAYAKDSAVVGSQGSINDLYSKNVDGHNFFIADLYQDESRYYDSTKGYTTEQLFKCNEIQGTKTQTAVFPTSPPGANTKQLQLKYLEISNESFSGFTTHCKPAIYLYPQEETDVNVKVKTKGELLYTKPLYPSAGWDVTAYPNGKIVYNGVNYDYLYYESRIPDSLIDKPKEGFVVLYKELSTLYDQILPKLGLSPKQVFDFKDYWEKVLPPSPYYFVGILSQENINQFEPLAINPKPETIIRVRFYFEALDEKIEVDEPVIKMPKKDGFTVVEWGGMVKRDKDHPFTCSE